MRTVAILLILALFGCSESLNQSVSEFEFLAPRPFGYVIGDEIRHHIVLVTRNQVKLQPASLPKQGALKRWLNLNKVAVNESRSGSGYRYDIDLDYQVFYAPQEVKMLTIPGFNLKLMLGEKQAEQAVPSWNFTLSPLRELAVRKNESGEYRRPDVEPEWLNETQPGLWLSAALALSSSVYLSYLYGFLPGLTRSSSFKNAGKKLAGLSEHEMGLGLSIFHQALNSAYRKPLFKSDLAEFYRDAPRYQAASAQLDWFFHYSNHYFFSGNRDASAESLDRLKKLCALCIDLERGGL